MLERSIERLFVPMGTYVRIWLETGLKWRFPGNHARAPVRAGTGRRYRTRGNGAASGKRAYSGARAGFRADPRD